MAATTNVAYGIPETYSTPPLHVLTLRRELERTTALPCVRENERVSKWLGRVLKDIKQVLKTDYMYLVSARLQDVYQNLQLIQPANDNAVKNFEQEFCDFKPVNIDQAYQCFLREQVFYGNTIDSLRASPRPIRRQETQKTVDISSPQLVPIEPEPILQQGSTNGGCCVTKCFRAIFCCR